MRPSSTATATPDVNAGVAPNTVSVPGRVHAPVLAQRGGNRPNYQVIQADLLTPLLEESVDARPGRDGLDHVDVDRQEKVRDRSEGFAQPPGNRLPHLRDLDVLKVRPFDLGGLRPGRG